MDGVERFASLINSMKGLKEIGYYSPQVDPTLFACGLTSELTDINTSLRVVGGMEGLTRSERYILDLNWAGRHLLQNTPYAPTPSDVTTDTTRTTTVAPVPLGLWPFVLARASQRRYFQSTCQEEGCSPHLVYYLIRQQPDLWIPR